MTERKRGDLGKFGLGIKSVLGVSDLSIFFSPTTDPEPSTLLKTAAGSQGPQPASAPDTKPPARRPRLRGSSGSPSQRAARGLTP